ncbi:heat shock protein 9/12-domain-containing protein [Mycena filopes]|nr:heat shock protein 9/12-domain-containing protein [Mycena filopes]
MSDTGRQSMTDKASAAMKPDSQKSTTEQLGDHFKGTGDKMASTFQPQHDKSATQKMGDTVTSSNNHNEASLADKAKNALGMGGRK